MQMTRMTTLLRLVALALAGAMAAEGPEGSFDIGLSIDRSAGGSQDLGLQRGSEDHEEPSLAQVSVLGLQRSVRLSRAGRPSAKEPSQPAASADGEQLGLADVSLLGLQRAVKVTKKAAPAPQAAARLQLKRTK
mmetsp:Transcript_33814/g.97178  ORF Transcript_33814/g.97178 Transcript_33814/m.97178 type:complete len:134 (-) Transcript_33814:69-470(-)